MQFRMQATLKQLLHSDRTLKWIRGNPLLSKKIQLLLQVTTLNCKIPNTFSVKNMTSLHIYLYLFWLCVFVSYSCPGNCIYKCGFSVTYEHPDICCGCLYPPHICVPSEYEVETWCFLVVMALVLWDSPGIRG